MSWWTRLRGHQSAGGGARLRAIRFDTDGWQSVTARDDALELRDTLGNSLRVSFHPRPAEHIGEPPDIVALRAFCRRSAEAEGGAIVSVDTVNIARILCLKAIEKYERPPGYDYKGTITIPLAASHYEIVMNATEHGTTGVREALVTSQLVM